MPKCECTCGCENESNGGGYEGRCRPCWKGECDANPVEEAFARMEQRPIYLATAETRHFVFDGCGETAEEARAALLRAAAVHIALTGAVPDFIQPEDISVRELRAGEGYRDGEPLPHA